MDFLSEKARRLTPYVAGLQPQGAGWVKLNTNENPYPPSPKVAEVLGCADVARLRLYPDGESADLCGAVASVYGVGAGNVFCANSSDEVLALAFQAFFSGKGNVVSPDISYGFYPVWAEMYDVGMVFAPLSKNFTIDPMHYEDTNGVVIANPNAPTSIAISLADVEQLLITNPRGVVLMDEAYMDFAQVESAVSLTKTYENLLVVRTFSKSHSLAGLRVGYAIGNEKLISGLRRVRDAFNSYPLDMLAQTAAAAAIKDTAYLKETISRIIQTRTSTIKALQSLNYNVLPSDANFIFMQNENAPAIYEHLRENKILVRHWNKPRIKDFLRVSIGTEEEMTAFCQTIKNYGG
ncbi:MAG: histidinol-phosphate transaminase [Defluviitaleaceae bacterium]|nr:histidinol-phosphate transaminase [Defluviitaleaceae bacterium]MCL2262627.1 histidinol-phosphate transaminase [Defluviitaleaceae bacterium]